MALVINSTVVPANSAFSVIADSTRGLMNSQASVATGGAGLIPGARRSLWARKAITYSALVTVQNATLLLEVMTGQAGAATDWETQGAGGTVTLTAGTTAVGEFKPLTAEWRVRLQAGATAPTAVTINLTDVSSEDYGS